jgi:hypothetical protein
VIDREKGPFQRQHTTPGLLTLKLLPILSSNSKGFAVQVGAIPVCALKANLV